MGKIYKTTVCKVLDIRQWRIMIPERWEINEVSLMIALAYSLGKFSAVYSTGRGNLDRGQWTPWVERWSWDSGENNGGGVHRTELQRGERDTHREIFKDLPSWAFKWVLVEINMRRICLWLGANITQITVPHPHTRLGIASAISQIRKPCGSHDTKWNGE